MVCLGQTHSHELQEPSKHTLTTHSSQESPCLSPFFCQCGPFVEYSFQPDAFWNRVKIFVSSPVVSKCQSPPTSHRFLSVGHLKLYSSVDVFLITFASTYEKLIVYCLCECLRVCVCVLFQFLFVTMIEHHDQKQLWIKEFMI